MSTPSSAPPSGVRDNFDAGSLSWVMGEIREALNKSKAALYEAASQDRDAQSTALLHAKSYLHQAHGALQIVDIDGVAIITETTEDLIDRLESGQIAVTQEIALAVENAYQALVEYLEELLSGSPHQPVRLFPYYKSLLEVRSAERIHPADLFFPNLAIRPQLPTDELATASAEIDYVSLRKRFEKSLLPLLRTTDPAAERGNAGAMRDIIKEVQHAQENQQSRAFWWVLHSFAEGVSDGQIPNELYVKQLFARINLQIRRLSEGSVSIAERLLRDALFFIAQIPRPSPHAVQVRSAYQLDGVVPADYGKKRYGQIDNESLVVAKTHLSQAKNLWNRIASGDASVADAFVTEMKGVAEIGGKLGSPSLSKLLRELNAIARPAAHAKTGDSLGMEMATNLLFVENAFNNISRLPENFSERADAMTARLLSIVSGKQPTETTQWLDEMSREAQQRQTMTALAEEMQSSLRQVEKSLDEYFREPGERTVLASIDQVLHQIGGALAILDQDDALRAVRHTQTTVRHFLESEVVPDLKEFQHVAQNVGALSFFIETLQLQPENAKTRFSFDDETGVFHANLLEKKIEDDVGLEIAIAPLPDAEHINGMTGDAESANVLSTVEDDLVIHQKTSADLAVSFASEPHNAALQEQLKESLEQVRLDATLVDNPEATDRAQTAIDFLEDPEFIPSPEALSEIVSATATAPVALAVAPTPVASPPVVAPEVVATDEAVDAELLEIFLSEAEEVLECVRQTVPESRAEPRNQHHLTTLRRSFHTLKGSGRMVGLNVFGEAAWSIEQALNVVLSDAQGGSDDLYALLDKSAELLGAWVADLQQDGRSNRTSFALASAAERVKMGDAFVFEEEMDVAASAMPADATTTDDEIATVALAPENAQEQEPAVESSVAESDTDAQMPVDAYQNPESGDNFDSSLDFASELPQAEEIDLSDTDLAAFHQVDTRDALMMDDVMADAPSPSVDQTKSVLLEPIDESIEELSDESSGELSEPPINALPITEPAIEDRPMTDAAATSPVVADVIDFPSMIQTDSHDDNVKQIGDLEISVPLHNIYLAETDELVRLLSHDLAEWRHEPERGVNILAVHAAHSLAGSSATVGFKSLQEVAHALEMVLQYLARNSVMLSEPEYDILNDSVERLKLMLQMFALGDMPAHEPAQVQFLANMLQTLEQRFRAQQAPPPRGSVTDDPEATVDADSNSNEEEALAAQSTDFVAADIAVPAVEYAEKSTLPEESLQPEDLMSSEELVLPEASAQEDPIQEPVQEPVQEKLAQQTAAVPKPAAPRVEVTPTQLTEIADQAITIKDELDADLLPVFLEEGNDMLPQMGEALRTWQQKAGDKAAPQALLRLLHTIKGSARMAGAMELGQHMHEMESRIEQISHSGNPSAQAMDDLLARHDFGLQLFDYLQNPGSVKPVAGRVADKASVEQESENAEASTAPAERGLVEMQSVVPIRPGSFVPSTTAVRATSAASSAVAAPSAPVPLVRVRADILDRLVNQAGEVSITRSKLETEVGTLRTSLSELTGNVARLRDQLREIEMQAETQITSRMALSGDREFDPLEFDRFTRLQEITRMMAESVNDVGSVQQNLARTVDNATNDLTTQGRLTRELQQDLMRVRMVQFASISERLYRVTRQASKELDKRVNLDIRGSAVEVDRSVLEKMAGPFEHLLRNAIVHGIETRENRRAAGKNEIGELLVEIRQEGNEVVIQFSDDGQGLDLDRIKNKARSLGLLTDESNLSETETTDLIFHPGFSTADAVTELAGRGVGMDVVRAEAAALGGRVAIVSELGKGAHFTIHLPLTLAVTQVVILMTGGKTYAVPSVLVEQVQQLKTNQLAAAYNDGAVMWQGNRVPLYYLSSLLGDKQATAVAQQYSPLVILKSGNDRVVVHVDQILGNREVVVKNIGPQLARLIGIAGATVLGSGEIVLILNPVPLAQRAVHESIRAPRLVDSDTPVGMGAVAEMVAHQPDVPQAEAVQGLRTQNIIMVVDDSLTVRRVTQRLLTREGYQVVLAKDGVDALEQLQAITPDVMLVDIEMPRMDGFDLTRNVRGDERTKHIPIIMITSRTATKHRNYAMELGVNEYLGKPYQEDDLLKSIAGFINDKAQLV